MDVEAAGAVAGSGATVIAVALVLAEVVVGRDAGPTAVFAIVRATSVAPRMKMTEAEPNASTMRTLFFVRDAFGSV